MERTRATWTDERLDDLSRRVESGFERVDARFDGVERRFDAVDRRFDALEARFDARFDALHRTMVQFMGAMTIGVLATLVSIILTQA